MDDIVVVKIIDNCTVAINKGSEDGIKLEDKFLIYEFLEEVYDPKTKESLGKLRLKKGTAVVDDIQKKMTVIVSDTFKNYTRKHSSGFGFSSIIAGTTEYTEKERSPFERDINVGDQVLIYNRK